MALGVVSKVFNGGGGFVVVRVDGFIWFMWLKVV